MLENKILSRKHTTEIPLGCCAWQLCQTPNPPEVGKLHTSDWGKPAKQRPTRTACGKSAEKHRSAFEAALGLNVQETPVLPKDLPPNFTWKAENQEHFWLGEAEPSHRGSSPKVYKTPTRNGAFLMSSVHRKSSKTVLCGPPTAFLMSSKMFDFLLIDLSFYFK